jgi:hypothetical protein
MSEPVKTDAARIAELEQRLERLEKYIAQLRAHGHLPNMRSEQ